MSKAASQNQEAPVRTPILNRSQFRSNEIVSRQTDELQNIILYIYIYIYIYIYTDTQSHLFLTLWTPGDG